jgi:hypothetical protein
MAVGLGAMLVGCPRREETPPAAVHPMGALDGHADALRCTLADRRYEPTSDVLESPWVLRGPDGPRVVGRAAASGMLDWRDARGDGSAATSLSLATHAVAWSGRGFVGVLDGRVTFTDARFESPRAVRRVSLDRAVAASVSTAAREGAVLISWLRAGREGEGEGWPWTGVVGPAGELLVDPAPLAGAPTALRALRSRWDFGRFVVEGETTGRNVETWSWVLDPDGRAAWSGVGPVVCPMNGCFRVEFGAGPGGRAQALRLVPLADPSGAIDTHIFTNDVLAAAVSGARLLVLSSPLQGEIGCAVHVFDVGRPRAPYESSSDAMSCAPGSVLATPSGFVLLEVDSARGLAARSLSCGDDA